MKKYNLVESEVLVISLTNVIYLHLEAIIGHNKLNKFDLQAIEDLITLVDAIPFHNQPSSVIEALFHTVYVLSLETDVPVVTFMFVYYEFINFIAHITSTKFGGPMDGDGLDWDKLTYREPVTHATTEWSLTSIEEHNKLTEWPGYKTAKSVYGLLNIRQLYAYLNAVICETQK